MPILRRRGLLAAADGDGRRQSPLALARRGHERALRRVR